MSTLALPMSQPCEVSRRRLSLRRVVVAPEAGNGRTSAMDSVKSVVAALPARLEALVRDNLPGAPRNAIPLESLMQGANTLPILHNGEVYTLRKTRLGKLILTK